MSLPPFPSVTQFLQIYPGANYEGLNTINLRDTVADTTEMVTKDTFSLVGSSTLIYGGWTTDSGDLTMSSATQETRIFCTKGMLTTTVSGTAIYIRLQLNSSWGTAEVYIDGKQPTEITGVINPLNTVDCNADNYPGLTHTQYRDILVADGLASGSHTVTLYANNSNPLSFFALSMIKGRSYSQQPYTFDAWKAAPSTNTNNNTLTFTNLGENTIINATLSIPSQILKQDGTSYGGSVTIGSLAAGASYALPYTIDGTGVSNSVAYTLGLAAQYLDPTGTIVVNAATTYAVSSPVLTFTGNWNFDNGAPNSTARAFTSGVGQKVSFSTDQTSFQITVQCDSGWGAVNVTVAGTSYGTVTSNDTEGGGFLKTFTVSGLPAGTKTVLLTSTGNGSAPFVFTSITLNTTTNYTAVTENVVLNYAYSEIPPFALTGTNITNGKIAWTAPNPTQTDYTIPRTNVGQVGQRIYTRFPTFAVYYSRGNAELLSQYDILIIEPSAVTRKQVAAWQAKGIIVIGYVSFGEEDSDKLLPFDLEDTQPAPYKDDGLGVGGYASYYCKGGNQFGEVSECQNDRQKLEGVKACAVSNPKYLTSVGRCSPNCSWDSVQGYQQQSTGGACGKGFTSSNFWQRDAMTACKNAACPQYLPLNQKCTQYNQTTDSYGQDFSILTTDFPDQNGIWGSSFINPIAPRWQEKLLTHYLPTVFNAPVPYVETLSLASYMASSGQTWVCSVTNFPFDDGETFTVTSADGSYVWTANLDFSYDAKSGIISFNAQTLPLAAGVPTLAAGTQVKVTYSRMGLECDGLFMDTVDSVDVYPSPAVQTAMANMINTLKTSYPNKSFTSNRGFTILNNIIKSCKYVMFESFLSDYNFDTQEYSMITDPAAIAFNNQIIEQLKTLRETHQFDVFGLNYCSNGSDGDAIRTAVMEQCYKLGFMSWTSTIDLNQPSPIQPQIVNLQGAIRNNAWELQQGTI